MAFLKIIPLQIQYIPKRIIKNLIGTYIVCIFSVVAIIPYTNHAWLFILIHFFGIININIIAFTAGRTSTLRLVDTVLKEELEKRKALQELQRQETWVKINTSL